MRQFWIALTCIAALGAVTGPVVSPAAASTGTSMPTRGQIAASAASPSTLGLFAISAGEVNALGDVTKYAYVVIQSWEPKVVAAIHQRSPTTKVLAYFNASNTQRQPCPPNPPTYAAFTDTPISFCWIRTYHPRWLLRSKRGGLLSYPGYPGTVAIDIGNAALGALWAPNAIKLAKANGYNGIYMDDVMLQPYHDLSGHMAKYNDRQYGAVMTRFAARAGDQIRRSGLLAVANTGLNPWVSWEVDEARRLAPHLNSMAREHSVRWGIYCGSQSSRFTDPYSNGNPALSTIQRFRTEMETLGEGIFGIDYGTGSTTPTADDIATMQYGRASFLLTWNGRPGSAYFFRTCGVNDPANPAWMVNPGTPTGPMTTTQDIWARPYSHGLVLLNPSPSQWVNYRLPLLDIYHDYAGNLILGSVSIPPRGARILLNG